MSNQKQNLNQQQTVTAISSQGVQSIVAIANLCNGLEIPNALRDRQVSIKVRNVDMSWHEMNIYKADERQADCLFLEQVTSLVNLDVSDIYFFKIFIHPRDNPFSSDTLAAWISPDADDYIISASIRSGIIKKDAYFYLEAWRVAGTTPTKWNFNLFSHQYH